MARWDLANKETAKAYLHKNKPGPKPKRKKRKDAGKPRKSTIQKLGPGRSGPMSAPEKELIERFLLARPEGEEINTATKRAKALAVVMGRSTETVRRAIVSAAQRLAERSEEYTDMHFVAAKIAAAKGDAAPSQWALERISAEGEEGKGRIRIIEPLKTEGDAPQMPTINIGLALGGIANPPVAMKQISPIATLVDSEAEEPYLEADESDIGDEP